MKKKFKQLKLQIVETAANFYLLVFKDQQEAATFTARCMDHGLILRHVIAFGIPNAVRINSGTDEETDFALEVIAKVQREMANR
jgi:histidinol-phosphate aminotransferase